MLNWPYASWWADIVRNLLIWIYKLLYDWLSFYYVIHQWLIDFDAFNYYTAEIFLSLIWGPNICPFPIKNEQKLPKMAYIIPNFLVLNFGENFIKIQTKIAKLQIHENCIKMWMKTCFHSHFYANFHEFYERQSKQHICYSFILLISIYLKRRSSINSSQFWWSETAGEIVLCFYRLLPGYSVVFWQDIRRDLKDCEISILWKDNKSTVSWRSVLFWLFTWLRLTNNQFRLRRMNVHLE